MSFSTFDGRKDTYTNTITISNSEFVNNIGPHASVIYLNLAGNLNLINVNIKGNITTTGNGFISMIAQLNLGEIHIINGEWSENTT